jgi:serine/threonine-protein kinase RsbW
LKAAEQKSEPEGLPDFFLEMMASREELSRCLDEMERHEAFLALPRDAQYAVKLVLDELTSNAIRHAPGGTPPGLRMCFWVRGGELTLRLDYEGPSFDPAEVPEPNTEAPLEERAQGGLGLFLLRNVMDEVRLSRENDRNCFLTRKSLTNKLNIQGELPC